jgi:hypothetical protein
LSMKNEYFTTCVLSKAVYTEGGTWVGGGANLFKPKFLLRCKPPLAFLFKSPHS